MGRRLSGEMEFFAGHWPMAKLLTPDETARRRVSKKTRGIPYLRTDLRAEVSDCTHNWLYSLIQLSIRQLCFKKMTVGISSTQPSFSPSIYSSLCNSLRSVFLCSPVLSSFTINARHSVSFIVLPVVPNSMNLSFCESLRTRHARAWVSSSMTRLRLD